MRQSENRPQSGRADPACLRTGLLRCVPNINEVWVTEPSVERIEIFTLSDQGTPVPIHSGFIAVLGGPDSHAIGHGQAFTHLWRGTTLAINFRSRKIVSCWPTAAKVLAASRSTKNADSCSLAVMRGSERSRSETERYLGPSARDAELTEMPLCSRRRSYHNENK